MLSLASKRLRALAMGLALLAGACSGLIGVSDIYYSDNLAPNGGEGGVEGGTNGEGGPMTDGGGADVVLTCNADLMTDLKNCGACGHDCSNGVCSGGLCMLAEQLASPNTMSVRGKTIYLGLIGGNGSIGSCPTNGCDSPTVGVKDLTGPDAGTPYPWHIAANDTYVFASDYLSGNNGGFRRVLVTGGDFRKYPAANLERSYGLAIDNTTVFWITTGAPGNLHWCNIPDCANGAQSAVVVNDGEYVQVASDGKLVWTENSGFALNRCASKTACTPAPLSGATFQGFVEDFTIDGNTVYWGTNYGEIMSCATGGCANPTKLVLEDAKAIIGAVAVSGTSLYWSTMPFAPDGNTVLDAEGSIRSCTIPKCSGADVRTIAKLQHDPNAMALDANSVYWANSGKRGYTDGIGNLMKAPR